jgi:hypothetical protein
MRLCFSHGEISLYSIQEELYNIVTWIYYWIVVTQLVEVLCYKSEGRGFDARWSHENFSLT